MPSVALEDRYLQWLRSYTTPEEMWSEGDDFGEEGEAGLHSEADAMQSTVADETKRLAFAQYMLANSSFNEEMHELGEALSDDELAAREAQEAQDGRAPQPEEEDRPQGMTSDCVQFCIGNVNIIHAKGLEEACLFRWSTRQPACYFVCRLELISPRAHQSVGAAVCGGEAHMVANAWCQESVCALSRYLKLCCPTLADLLSKQIPLQLDLNAPPQPELLCPFLCTAGARMGAARPSSCCPRVRKCRGAAVDAQRGS